MELVKEVAVVAYYCQRAQNTEEVKEVAVVAYYCQRAQDAE